LKPSVFDNGAVDRFYEGLAREGIRVANGIWFGDEARVFRLGFGLLSKADLEAALTRLSAAARQVSHEAV
jgi:DNA-binding transcriptional MocR family regulator